MTNCKQCNKEIEQIEGKETRVFCSDRCRKAFSRNIGQNPTSDNIGQPTSDKERINPNTGFKERTYSLEEVCSPEELRDFPRMCETRKSYKESIYRLENNDVEKLRKVGVWIPSHYGK